LKTISHRNPEEKPFEVGVSGWGLCPVLQHVWHNFASRATELKTREALQTTASLIGQGCRNLKSSGRTWLFLVRYLLYGFTVVGLNPTKIHHYKTITCPVRDDGVYDFFLLHIFIIISSSLLFLYITHCFLIYFRTVVI
jgi:hypothetical protein